MAPEGERDIMAEHFGPDWRTSFTFRAPPPRYEPSSDASEPGPAEQPAPGPEVEAEDDTPRIDDPYVVLGLDPSASWEEIVEAHRRLARLYHPDRQAGAGPALRAAAEDDMRTVNAAYAELKVRRGRR